MNMVSCWTKLTLLKKRSQPYQLCFHLHTSNYSDLSSPYHSLRIVRVHILTITHPSLQLRPFIHILPFFFLRVLNLNSKTSIFYHHSFERDSPKPWTSLSSVYLKVKGTKLHDIGFLRLFLKSQFTFWHFLLKSTFISISSLTRT